MTEIKTVVVRGKKKTIEVNDGLVLVFCGHGPYDAAFYKKLEDCTDGELAAVEAVEETAQTNNNLPAAAEATSEEDYHITFNAAVDFLTHCSGEDFLEIVRYAKKHNNTFWHCISEVADIVNADDAYCSSIIQLARPLGEIVERRAFKLFEAATADDENADDFIDFWKALQVINYFC